MDYLKCVPTENELARGNGRCQRLFLQLLCDSLGYELDFTKISQKEMLEASDRSFKLDYDLLESLMAQSLKQKTDIL